MSPVFLIKNQAHLLPMKKSLYSLILAAFVSMTAAFAQAGEVPSEAVVLSVAGMPMVSIHGQAPIGLKAGDKLSEGAVVTTPANSEVVFKAFEHSETTLKANSRMTLSKLSLTTENGKITKQTALLDLSVGGVVSQLDPKLKEINDYGIRTPRGIAAARGTKYAVYVGSSGYVTTLVLEGTVVFVNQSSGQRVEVKTGFAVTVGPDGKIGELRPITSGERAAFTGQISTERSLSEFEVIKNDSVDPTIITVSPSSP